MNPFWLVTRVAGAALLTAAAGTMVLKRLSSGSPDMVAGAIHFRKGMEEFQKGLSAVFLGTSDADAEKAREARESSRIPIE